MSKFSVKKPYTVLVAVILVIVLGVVSFTKMTTDLLPSISLPYVIVMTTYPGASPETVEMVVTQPIESGMATVSNIESISSTSSENYSVVILEFAQSADMNAVSLEIRESLDQIKAYWDDSVGNPIIMKLNPDMLPVMIAAVGVEGMEQGDVSSYVLEEIIPELESIEGVASADASGLLEERVNVVIRQEKIDAVNAKIFASIDEKMQEAYDQIADGELEIADGEKELEAGRQELLDSQKELENGKKELENGKAELQKGKDELNSKQNEINAQLAIQKNALLTAKTALTEIQSNLTQAEQLNAGITQIDLSLTKLGDLKGISVAYADGLLRLRVATALGDSNAILEATEKINGLKDKITTNELLLQAIASSEELQKLLSIEELKALDWADTANAQTVITAVGTIEATVGTMEAEINASRDKLSTALNAVTSGLGYDGYVEMVNGQLAAQNITDLAKAIADMNQGLVEIEKGQMAAAIEMANGKATMALGEYKLELAQAQLDSASQQLETGLEQMEDAKQQLEDAKKQLEDGKKELETSKQQAYESADMTEILTIDSIKGILTAQNFSMPAGYITEEGIDYLIRIGDKPEDIEELKQLPLMDLHMDQIGVVLLEDVADVFYSDNSDKIYTNVNGNPGVMLTMQKQTGYSTGDVSDKLLKKFDSLMEENKGLNIITLMDQGIYIDLVMDSIINNVLFGALLAIIILILFLKDIRPTLVVAFSIPISLVFAIVCMYFSGVTLNVISLSGLALGIGMLVDNSIVVIENIYRMKKEGKSTREAAIEGAREVSGAIVASTLTTVCVFLPIVFTEGITRQLFVDMGLTIGFALFASLLVALTVVPAMASKMLGKSKEAKEGVIFGALTKGYTAVLKAALRVKPLVFVLVLVLLVGSIFLSFTRGTAFMPAMDSPQMTVSVALEQEDATLKDTARVTDEVVRRLQDIGEITDIGAMTSSSTTSMLGGSGGSTTATTIYLVTKEDKERSNEELAEEIKERTADIEARISVETSSMDMTALGGSGISIQIRGRDLDMLQSIAGDISQILSQVEGVGSVSDGLEEEKGEEIRILVNREKAAEYGLMVAQVFTQISPKIASESSATNLSTVSKDYPVYVTSEKNNTITREQLEALEISGTDKEGKAVKVPLGDIATFETAKSLSSISRADQSRYISVTASIASGYNVGLVGTEIERAMADYQVPSGYRLVYSGENETINEAMGQVLLMLLLAVVFMYLIMVAQFQSLLSPFIIMFTIPLAFTGGFLGLYVSGSEVSIIALIGFVMLAGIIVNNGIVLIDYMNQLMEAGMSRRDAIIRAGQTRLRPVLMTALTTILALSTMVFSKDMGADMAKPMAIVTIGGLLYGTLLTLVVIPCVYDVFARLKKRPAENE